MVEILTIIGRIVNKKTTMVDYLEPSEVHA